ncbi:MAG TPA: hypothetical protein VGV37_29745 [Aliidongia sp.]|uniref:hypothetical protein n=1 Tax=Aliidongia sp. TaxID=1914230 RepID=UPI002DDD4196|nr:hypothetical protein [Aliidongia sp.]HEV2678748.1 hypothetical protein [Aliidongia sp.]
MAANTMSDALKTATDALQERIEALQDATRYQMRKGVPRAERAIKAGYADAAEVVRGAAGKRSVQVGVAVGLLALVAGVLLSRR